MRFSFGFPIGIGSLVFGHIESKFSEFHPNTRNVTKIQCQWIMRRICLQTATITYERRCFKMPTRPAVTYQMPFRKLVARMLQQRNRTAQLGSARLSWVKRFDLSVERLNGFRPEMIRLCRVISSQIIVIWIHSSQCGCEMHVLNLIFIISNESRSCAYAHEKCILKNKPHLKTINSMHIMKRSSLIVRFLPSRTWRCYKPSEATQVCEMRRCCRHNKSHTRKTAWNICDLFSTLSQINRKNEFMEPNHFRL